MMMTIERIHPWRRFKNGLTTLCCVLATLLGLLFLTSILWILISRGAPHINLALFTKVTPPPGELGGIEECDYW